MKMQTTTYEPSGSPRRGFTILELLIAIVIIGILVAIIVPVYVSRANQARITACQTDLDGLKSAEEHAAIDTSYFYRLYTLIDGKKGDGIPPSLPNDSIVGVRDELSRTDATNPTNMFIDTNMTPPDGGQLYTGAQATLIYDRLARDETAFNWNGPYVNYSRKYTYADFNNPTPKGPVGLPLDPWGNPYMLFTSKGYVQEPEGVIVPNVTIGTNTYSCTGFDRATVLSLGPDGMPGDGKPTSTFGQGDDMFRQF